MSFNRRGGSDRRPDRPHRDRYDRPRGDWEPREPRGGGDRPYQPRGGDRPYQPRGGDRPYQPRDRSDEPRGGDRPFAPRPGAGRGPQDEGGMSIRLDPRRVNALKHLAGEAGMRPGDLVRQWVEERIDAQRIGPDGKSLEARLEELAARVAALEAGGAAAPTTADEVEPPAAPVEPAEGQLQPEPPDLEALVEAGLEPPDTTTTAEPAPAGATTPGEPEPEPEAPKRRRNAVSAAPRERVALHDEMIAVLRERGPMTAAELAATVAERGRYAPPRSGKPLDAAMISQRVSNPVYRSRFTRDGGRIGLAEEG